MPVKKFDGACGAKAVMQLADKIGSAPKKVVEPTKREVDELAAWLHEAVRIEVYKTIGSPMFRDLAEITQNKYRALAERLLSNPPRFFKRV